MVDKDNKHQNKTPVQLRRFGGSRATHLTIFSSRTGLPKLPFLGLRPFEKHEARIFKGRNEQINQLLDRLSESHFVSVVGPSGCGKSSLIRAGVIPALESGDIRTAGVRWITVTATPSDSPYLRLGASLADAFSNVARSYTGSEEGAQLDPREVAAVLARGDNGLIEAVNHCKIWLTQLQKKAQTDVAAAHESAISETNVLVVIDQFEEIFRFSESINVENAFDFVKLLLHIKNQDREEARSGRVYVVLTMRTDHFGDCARIPNLVNAINETIFLTADLTEPQLREAIVQPLRLYGATIDNDVIEKIVSDIRKLKREQQQSDYLPLTQHALMRMWMKAESKSASEQRIELSMDHYKAVGGVEASLAEHAKEALQDCIEQVGAQTQERVNQIREFIKVFFQCLTERRRLASSQDVRRPATFQEVLDVSGWTREAQKTDAKKIIDVYRREEVAFVRPFLSGPVDGETMLDITHESLIRQWKDLQEWVSEEAKSAERIEQLVRYSKEPGKSGKGPELLDKHGTLNFENWWSNRRPEPTANWASRYGIDHKDFSTARLYLEASDDRMKREAEAKQRKIEEEERQKREKLREKYEAKVALEQARRKNVVLRMTASFASLTVIFLVFLAWQFQNKNADLERKTEELSILQAQQYYGVAVEKAASFAQTGAHAPSVYADIDTSLDLSSMLGGQQPKQILTLIDSYISNAENIKQLLRSYVSHMRREPIVGKAKDVDSGLGNLIRLKLNFASKPMKMAVFETGSDVHRFDGLIGVLGECGEFVLLEIDSGKASLVDASRPGQGEYEQFYKKQSSDWPASLDRCTESMTGNEKREQSPRFRGDVSFHHEAKTFFSISEGAIVSTWPIRNVSDPASISAVPHTVQVLKVDGSKEAVNFHAIDVSADGQLVVTASAIDSALNVDFWRVLQSSDSQRDGVQFKYIGNDNVALLNAKKEKLPAGEIVSVDLGGEAGDRVAVSTSTGDTYIYSIDTSDPENVRLKNAYHEQTGVPRAIDFSDHSDSFAIANASMGWVLTRAEKKSGGKNDPAFNDNGIRYLSTMSDRRGPISEVLALPGGLLALGDQWGQINLWHHEHGGFSEFLGLQKRRGQIEGLVLTKNKMLVSVDQDWGLYAHSLHKQSGTSAHHVTKLESNARAIAADHVRGSVAVYDVSGKLQIIARDGRVLSEYYTEPNNPILALSFIQGGDFIASVDKTGQLLLRSAKFSGQQTPFKVLDNLFQGLGDDTIDRLEFVKESNLLFATSSRGNVSKVPLSVTSQAGEPIVADVGTVVRLEKSEFAACAIAVDPKGSYVAVGRSDGNIHLYDAKDFNLKERVSIPLDGFQDGIAIKRLVFSRDGKRIAALGRTNNDGSLKSTGACHSKTFGNVEEDTALFVYDLDFDSGEQQKTARHLHRLEIDGTLAHISFGPWEDLLIAMEENGLYHFIDLVSERSLIRFNSANYARPPSNNTNTQSFRFDEDFNFVCSEKLSNSQACSLYTLVGKRLILAHHWSIDSNTNSTK